jgi:DNA gyrase subunit B
VVDAMVQATTLTAESLKEPEQIQAQEQLDAMLEYLEARHPELADWLERNPTKRTDDPQHSAKKYVLRTEVNGGSRETTIDYAFLSSPEYRGLTELKEAFAAFGPAPYTLVIGDTTVVANTYQQVLKASLDDASKGVVIQRYKGLGEMNPSQLAETTMALKTRTMLQVRVSDLIETDKLVTLLMGDEVEPRRDFIVKNALTANLDV